MPVTNFVDRSGTIKTITDKSGTTKTITDKSGTVKTMTDVVSKSLAIWNDTVITWDSAYYTWNGFKV